LAHEQRTLDVNGHHMSAEPLNANPQEQAFISLLSDISRTIHVQVALVRGCVNLHPNPSATFRELINDALSRLLGSVNSFDEELQRVAIDQDRVSILPSEDLTEEVDDEGEAEMIESNCPLALNASEFSVVECDSQLEQPHSTMAVGSRSLGLDGTLKRPPKSIIQQTRIATTPPLQASNGESCKAVVQHVGESMPLSEIHSDDPKPTQHEHSNMDRTRASQHRLQNHARNMRLSEIEDLTNAPTIEDLEAKDRHGLCSSGVLDPQWTVRLAWDVLVILIVLLDAMVLPFQFAYLDGNEPVMFDAFWLWLTTSFFTADIVINFFTGYTAGDHERGFQPGALVTSKLRIARSYVTSWFPIDFVSTVPWDKLTVLLTGGSSSSSGPARAAKLTKVLKFIRFLRLMRMLRLAKLGRIWERVEMKLGSLLLLQTVAFGRVMFVIIAICHWNACIWWMIGQPRSIFTDVFSDGPRETFAAQRHWTTDVDPTTGQSWQDKAVIEAYVFCFYWTLGVMRTMPAEVQPVNIVERIYVMVFMFFAFSAFAISIALITQTFFKFSERKRMFNEDMAAVRMYLRNINAAESLQMKVKSFMRYLFERRRILAKETNVVLSLPQPLIEKMKCTRLAAHLTKLALLQGMPQKAVQIISELTEVRDMAPGDILCVRDRWADATWILLCGRLQAFSGRQALDEHVEVVDENCLLADDPVKSELTVVAVVCSEVARIDRARFYTAMTRNPRMMQNFQVARSRSNMSGRQLLSGRQSGGGDDTIRDHADPRMANNINTIAAIIA